MDQDVMDLLASWLSFFGGQGNLFDSLGLRLMCLPMLTLGPALSGNRSPYGISSPTPVTELAKMRGSCKSVLSQLLFTFLHQTAPHKLQRQSMCNDTDTGDLPKVARKTQQQKSMRND